MCGELGAALCPRARGPNPGIDDYGRSNAWRLSAARGTTASSAGAAATRPGGVYGHDPSPDDAGYRRSGQGRSERSSFAAPPRRSGLLGDQGLVLCSAARPPGRASRRPTVSTR